MIFEINIHWPLF